MRPRRQFGHDAAIRGMHFNLAEHNIGDNLTGPDNAALRGRPQWRTDNRRRGFIAAGLDSQ